MSYTNNYKEQKLNDFNREEQVNKLLADIFYKIHLETEEPITNKQQQLKGIDIISKGFINIDLKNAITRLDGDLDTFCLELIYKNSANKFHKGWFLNAGKLDTHYYSFNYFTHSELSTKDKADCKYMKKLDDIGTAEFIIVHKTKLRNYIKSFYTEQIISVIKEMIHTSKVIYKINDELKLFQSIRLNERPVNLLINKSKLIELSHIHAKTDIKTNKTEFFKQSKLV